jgi:hypothetical protein
MCFLWLAGDAFVQERFTLLQLWNLTRPGAMRERFEKCVFYTHDFSPPA